MAQTASVAPQHLLPSPFEDTAAAEHFTDPSDYLPDVPVQEDVSDGLVIFRKASSWLLPTYTRKDCRCGHCSIGDPEPCMYAKPDSPNSLTSMLSTGRRSLTRLLSVRDQTSKDT